MVMTLTEHSLYCIKAFLPLEKGDLKRDRSCNNRPLNRPCNRASAASFCAKLRIAESHAAGIPVRLYRTLVSVTKPVARSSAFHASMCGLT